MWTKGTDLVIKESKFQRWGTLGIVVVINIVTLIFYKLCKEEMQKEILVIGNGIAWLVFLAIVFLHKKKDPVIIGKDGVSLSNQENFTWDVIDYAYVHTVNYVKNHYTYVVVEHHDEEGKKLKAERLINRMSYDKSDIEKAVNYWSGRTIGSKLIADFDKEIKEKVNEGKLTTEESEVEKIKADKYLPLFENEASTESMIIIVVLFICLFLGYNIIPEILPYGKPGYAYVSLIIGCLSLVFLLGNIIAYINRLCFLVDKKIAKLTEEDRVNYFRFVKAEENYPKSFLRFIIVAAIAFGIFVFA